MGLEAIYNRIFRRLADNLLPSPKKLCQRVLLWILHAARPLHLTELEQALILETAHNSTISALDYSRKDLILVCGSLVSVNIQQNTIQLIHLSTKEYLISQCTAADTANKSVDKAVQEFLIPPEDANTRITKYCLKYFQRQELGKPLSERRFQNANQGEVCAEFPFLDYSSLNWTYHLSQIRSGPESIKSASHSVSSYCLSPRSLTWMEAVMMVKGPDVLLSLIEQIRDWAETILAINSDRYSQIGRAHV